LKLRYNNNYDRCSAKKAFMSRLQVLPVLQREPLQHVPALLHQEKGEERQEGQGTPPALPEILTYGIH
jgi:hypothetical protein